jgi:hypothetical protein
MIKKIFQGAPDLGFTPVLRRAAGAANPSTSVWQYGQISAESSIFSAHAGHFIARDTPV